MPAGEAQTYGFLNGVDEDYDACLKSAYDMARQIASKSPLAITGIKNVLNHGRGRPVEEGLNYVATWNAGMLMGEDLQKAAMAALMKQEAEFEDLAS
jgi:enoyl-CoA hydratase